jgi:hypothetical protein
MAGRDRTDDGRRIAASDMVASAAADSACKVVTAMGMAATAVAASAVAV